MSRRLESRELDSKRYRSKFDRYPSPKRSRRDGKPATERPSGNLHLEGNDHSDRDQKHNQRLRDALPLEAPPAPEPKMESVTKSKETERRTSEKTGKAEGMKSSSNATDAPRPRSYQHDERKRRHIRGDPTERGSRRDFKDQHSEKTTEKIETRVSEQKDDKRKQTRGDDNHAWRHDSFYKMERDQQPSGRKRPAFRERKDEVTPQNTEKNKAEDVPNGEERKEDRVGRDSRESQRGNFLERDRYRGGATYRGRERYNEGRRGYQPGGLVRVEKWKHDLYEEANRSPTPKNEEDHIAKVEALLAS